MSPQKRKRSFSQEPENVHAGVFQNAGPPPSPGSQRMSDAMENGHQRDQEPYSPRSGYPHHPDTYPPPSHDPYPASAHHGYSAPSSARQNSEVYPGPERHSLVRNGYDGPLDPSIESSEARPYFGPDARMAEALQRENRNYDSMSRDQYGTPEDDDDQQYGDYGGGRGSQSGMEMERKRRKRVFSNRTKTGCMTCRRRKKKCDELHPECKHHMVSIVDDFECRNFAPSRSICLLTYRFSLAHSFNIFAA